MGHLLLLVLLFCKVDGGLGLAGEVASGLGLVGEVPEHAAAAAAGCVRRGDAVFNQLSSFIS